MTKYHETNQFNIAMFMWLIWTHDLHTAEQMHFLGIFWALLFFVSGLSAFRDRIAQEKAQGHWRNSKNLRGLAQGSWGNLVDWGYLLFWTGKNTDFPGVQNKNIKKKKKKAVSCSENTGKVPWSPCEQPLTSHHRKLPGLAGWPLSPADISAGRGPLCWEHRAGAPQAHGRALLVGSKSHHAQQAFPFLLGWDYLEKLFVPRKNTLLHRRSGGQEQGSQAHVQLASHRWISLFSSGWQHLPHLQPENP